MNASIKELAATIAGNQCALFVGAGVTAASGGATWGDLIHELKQKFNYSSPLKDYFEIIGDLSEMVGPENVYENIRQRLSTAKISEPLLDLFQFNWFTTFTTNYDLALENALHEKQERIIRTILTGNEFALVGIQSELLCVKLMGSLDVTYRHAGSMVITPEDMVVAREQRSRIFDILASHAANLSFLFLGYSFDDYIFFEMVQKLTNLIGKPDKTYFAVFRSEPDEEKQYLLERYNIKYFISDLNDFSKKLSKEVKLRDPKDLRYKRIVIGDELLPVDSRGIGDFLNSYDPVLFEDFHEEVSANSFFKGYLNSYKPFAMKWHFPRSQTNELVKLIRKKNAIKDKSNVIIVEGDPGSGRSMIILASVYKLMTSHRSIAIKTSGRSYKKIPTIEEIENFTKQIKKDADNAKIPEPERILLYSLSSVDEADILKFRTIEPTHKLKFDQI